MRRSDAHEGHLFDSVWVHYWRFYPDGCWTRCVSQDVELPFWTLTERDGAGAKETFTSGTFEVTEAGALVIKEPAETLDAQARLREYRWTIESDRLLPEPSGLPDHVALSFVPSDPAKAAQDPRSSTAGAATLSVETPAPSPIPFPTPVTSTPILGRSHPHRPGPVVDAGRVREQMPSEPTTAPSANALGSAPTGVGSPEPMLAADKVGQNPRTFESPSSPSQSAPIIGPRLTSAVPMPVIRTAPPVVATASVTAAAPGPLPAAGSLPATTHRVAPPAERSVPARAAETTPSPKSAPGALQIPIAPRRAEIGPAPARVGRLAPQLSASPEPRVEQDVPATRPRYALGGWAISLSAAPLMLLWAQAVATLLRSAFDGGDAAPRVLAAAQGLAGCVGWGCLLWLAWNPSPQEKLHLRPIDAWLWLGVVSMFLSPQVMLLGPPAFLLAAIVRGRQSNGLQRQSSWKRPLFALEATAAAVPCALAVVGALPTALRAGVFAMPHGALGAGLPGLLVALAVGLALQQYVVLVVNTIAGTAYRFGWWSWLALPGAGLAIQVAMEAWRVEDAGRFAATAPILLVTLHFVLLQPWRARRDRARRPRLQPVS